jgi:hypothetical protein
MAGHEGPHLTLRVHPDIAKALKTRESLLMVNATLHWELCDIY